MLNPKISEYHSQFTDEEKAICHRLYTLITMYLPNADSIIWHRHPVWFLDKNPIVGYSLQKKGIRLMFWSGAAFDEPHLHILGKKFKDASIFYNHINEVSEEDIHRWLVSSKKIQFDYKNIVKKKGRLDALIIE